MDEDEETTKEPVPSSRRSKLWAAVGQSKAIKVKEFKEMRRGNGAQQGLMVI